MEWSCLDLAGAQDCAQIAVRRHGRRVAHLRLSSIRAWEDVKLFVGGVAEGSEHCPQLAAQALAQMAPLGENRTTEA
jgi:hypothetical protein